MANKYRLAAKTSARLLESKMVGDFTFDECIDPMMSPFPLSLPLSWYVGNSDIPLGTALSKAKPGKKRCCTTTFEPLLRLVTGSFTSRHGIQEMGNRNPDEYIIKGFAMDDERLKQIKHFGQDYFDELLGHS